MKSAPKPCTHPSCGTLVHDGSGRCAKHAKQLRQSIDAKRGNSTERGYSYAWQQAREGFLRKHPLCVRHESRGQVVAATVVDHIRPHKGDKDLFWERSNWQSLCKTCHDIKTATEDGGFGRSKGRGAFNL